MRPEYPDMVRISTLLRVTDCTHPAPCEMVRGPYACGNDAYTLHVYLRGDGGTESLAVCDLCQDELYKEGNQTTQHWRKQQREWGVR